MTKTVTEDGAHKRELASKAGDFCHHVNTNQSRPQLIQQLKDSQVSDQKSECLTGIQNKKMKLLMKKQF